MKLKNLLLPLLLLSIVAKAQIPAGYYNSASGLTGAAQKTALYNIIKNHTALSYSALWNAFQTTDDKPDGSVWDMYSNCTFTFGSDQCGTYGIECDCYNREHSFPQSWFNSNSPMVSDLFHIYPTDGKVNGMRENYPFGEVGTASYTSQNGSKLGSSFSTGYTNIVFEPIDEYKGDFARTYFYMATRYENLIVSWQGNLGADEVLNGTTYPCYDQWFIDLLLAWNAADPVSQKEIDRNNTIYTSFQHNRNPYIDHPEYVGSVWGFVTTPNLVALPLTLSNFTYAANSGPSVSQTFSLSGTALSPSNGNIAIAGSLNYEVSSNNINFGGSVTIPYTAATLANTPIFVRLKTGLAAGNYNNETISVTGGGATPISVSCNGNVTVPLLPEPTNSASNFSIHNIQLQWTDATGSVIPSGYLVRMSEIGYSAIQIPVDGVTYPFNHYDQDIPYGQQSAIFKDLIPNTVYYFKLFGYTGSGSTINYKTDG
ncbi:MAG: endonuclease, partial [Bacteroidales bacterium]